jgi:hypothetical protein
MAWPIKQVDDRGEVPESDPVVIIGFESVEEGVDVLRAEADPPACR